MKTQSKFPDLSKQHSTALEKSEVKLDGQKVLFDKKVMLMPIELEKKTHKNGQQRKVR